MSRCISGLWKILVLSSVAFAQEHVHHSATPTSRVSIDGAVHPELISDQEAITIFFLTIMEPPTAGEIEKARFSAKTGRMHLVEQDAALLWAAAQRFHEQFQPHKERADRLARAAGDHGKSSDDRTAAQLQRISVVRNIDDLALTTYTDVLARLSPAGAESLKAHIAYVKTKMQIIPGPKM
jgi:hypothetical protein